MPWGEAMAFGTFDGMQRGLVSPRCQPLSSMRPVIHGTALNGVKGSFRSKRPNDFKDRRLGRINEDPHLIAEPREGGGELSFPIRHR